MKTWETPKKQSYDRLCEKIKNVKQTKGPLGKQGALFGGRIMLLPILRERYWQNNY
jgi:hypothetical protein